MVVAVDKWLFISVSEFETHALFTLSRFDVYLPRKFTFYDATVMKPA